MNFLVFGIILIEFCSAWRCSREKARIKELFRENEELQIERDQLAAEQDCNIYFDEIEEINDENDKLNMKLELKEEEIRGLKLENGKLRRQLEDASAICTTEPTETETSNERLFVNFLVIPEYYDSSYLIKKDGSISAATISAPTDRFTKNVKHALVKGQLFIFGGSSDSKKVLFLLLVFYENNKIARLDGCRFNELSARLNKYRGLGTETLSIDSGSLALICFEVRDKSCETFDGTTAVTTFSATWTHYHGGLGMYRNHLATVGCYNARHKKAETLSSTGWSALPDFPERINSHSIVGLDNESMLLFGGYISGEPQTGIWQLKNDQWNKIGELATSATGGSVFYSGRSIYYFGYSIQRIDLNEKEELEKVELIGKLPKSSFYPVLFSTTPDFCV
ncbi:unnamed protein product [Oikopleura dioica]|uniref:Uncharacterized protein n=1 Tax=Oikopleura dioica TaxID=34765 RepID=E4XZC3_OIKDI|nr:unnamed protein product [Oikopleura dioica]